MIIKKFVGGVLESNGYVIYQREGGDCFVIDPGYKSKNFIEFIREKNLNLRGVLLTHHHPDHVGAVKGLVSAMPADTFIHECDSDKFRGPSIPVKDNHIFDLEGEEIRVVNTPGHTRGGICFVSEKSNLAFTGDTIFADEVGRSDLEDSDRAELARSIGNIIDKWPDDRNIYPGHGRSTKMDDVKKNNIDYLNAMERYRCQSN